MLVSGRVGRDSFQEVMTSEWLGGGADMTTDRVFHSWDAKKGGYLIPIRHLNLIDGPW